MRHYFRAAALRFTMPPPDTRHARCALLSLRHAVAAMLMFTPLYIFEEARLRRHGAGSRRHDVAMPRAVDAAESLRRCLPLRHAAVDVDVPLRHALRYATAADDADYRRHADAEFSPMLPVCWRRYFFR